MKITNKQYLCSYLREIKSNSSITELPWDQMAAVPLVETVSAGACKEATFVKACWSDQMLYFQFICEDHYIRSDYTLRDEPLYNQDVIEIFIDELGLGKRYMEIEVSPNNVVFDAIIKNDGNGTILETDLEWNIAQLETVVVNHQEQVIYYVGIPLDSFESKLEHGQLLRVNFYRIDEDQAGIREYQAWSPTGAVQYHLPQKFGTLILQ